MTEIIEESVKIKEFSEDGIESKNKSELELKSELKTDAEIESKSELKTDVEIESARGSPKGTNRNYYRYR